MSSTMTLTMNALPQPRLSTIPCCPNCGNDLSLNLPPKLGPAPPEGTTAALAAAQRQIEDLQAQVRLLNQKATAAVDRWADYEDELAKLRSELSEHNTSSTTTTTTTTTTDQRNNSIATLATSTTTATRPQTPTVKEPPGTPSKGNYTTSPGAGVSGFASAASSRISALLSRKSTPNLKAVGGGGGGGGGGGAGSTPGGGHQVSQSTSSLLHVWAPGAPTPGHQSSHSTSSLMSPRSPLTLSLSSGKVTYTPGRSPAPSSDDLIEALGREQQMRVAAEGKLTDGSREIEELSITLFEQANEMVASERRARARLEERVGELERREEEKKHRLERLEKAVGRIERVRSLLGDGSVIGEDGDRKENRASTLIFEGVTKV